MDNLCVDDLYVDGLRVDDLFVDVLWGFDPIIKFYTFTARN